MLYDFSRIIFAILLRILFRSTINGRENLPDAPYVIASNHASILDPALVGIACSRHRVSFMAKKELFETPVLGSWARHVGCISVKRGENTVRSIKEAIKKLNSGKVVGVFPEGTRSLDGTLQKPKRGVGFLIARAHVPVLPVFIKGSSNAAPKTGGLKLGEKIDIFIGKPVPVEEFVEFSKSKDYDKIGELLMKKIKQLDIQ